MSAYYCFTCDKYKDADFDGYEEDAENNPQCEACHELAQSIEDLNEQELFNQEFMQ